MVQAFPCPAEVSLSKVFVAWKARTGNESQSDTEEQDVGANDVPVGSGAVASCKVTLNQASEEGNHIKAPERDTWALVGCDLCLANRESRFCGSLHGRAS